MGTIAINDATDDGTGEIELNSIGAAGVGSGAITVGHATTDKITLDGTVYKTGNALFTAKTGETIDMSAAATFTLSDKTLEFATGTVKLADAANLTVGTGNGAITIHSIEGTSHEDISLTSTGTIKPGTIGATLVSGINDITITGPSTLTGNITAASDGDGSNGGEDAALVNFNGAVIISGDITVDTDRVAADGAGADADANDGAITFGSTILSADASSDSLTIKSGSGALTFSGIIGGTTGKSLTGFDVNHLAGSAAISLPRIGAADRSFAGTSGVTRIGNAATTSITLSGDDYTFSGGATTLTTAGDITFSQKGDGTDGMIQTDNNLTLNAGADGTGALKVTGDFRILTTSDNDVVDIQSDITGVDDTSTESILIDLDTTSNAGGTIKIAGTVDGANAAGGFKTITLKGTDGVHLGGALTADHNAAGNNIDIDGPVTLTAALTVDTTANSGTIDFSSTVNSDTDETNALTLKSKGGTIKINGIIGGTQNIGALKINDNDANGTGAITLSGVGASNKVGITGTVDVGHTGTTGIDLAGSYYNINGATVFTTADTADIIDIKAAQTIKTSNDDVSFVQGTIALDDNANLTIDAGTGTVTLTTIGAVHDEVIDITGGTINAGIIGNGEEVLSVKLTGSTAVNLGGDIVTSNATGNFVDINGPAVLTETGIDINTSANNGTIHFDSTINSEGAEDNTLTLKAKGGDITVAGIIGGTSDLGLSLIHI